MISRIGSHSCQMMVNQTSIQLNNEYIIICNLKFGYTWASIYEIELDMILQQRMSLFNIVIYLHCRIHGFHNRGYHSFIVILYLH